MTGLKDAQEFLVELINQLFHADVLKHRAGQRIEAFDDEAARLRLVRADWPAESAGF